MDYHICIKSGDKIASFEHQSDRDICLDALQDYFDLPDDYFTAVNDEIQ